MKKKWSSSKKHDTQRYDRNLSTLLLLLSSLICVAEEKKTLPLLVDTNGTVLMTNATFSSLYGKRVTFWPAGGGTPKAFDISLISETNLAALKLDAKAANSQQQKMEDAKKAAAAAQVGDPPGDAKVVQIQKIVGSIGYEKCLANIPGEGAKEILIHLPGFAKNFLIALDKAVADEALLQNAYRIAKKNYTDFKANLKTFVGTYEFERQQEDAQHNKLQALDAKQDQAETEARAAALRVHSIKLESQKATIVARFSGKNYGSLEIWEPATLSTGTAK